MIEPGDIVKIVLKGIYNDPSDVIIGTVLNIIPEMPHIPPDSAQLPGPIFKVKILKMSGDIWDSSIDQRDAIEIL